MRVVYYDQYKCEKDYKPRGIDLSAPDYHTSRPFTRLDFFELLYKRVLQHLSLKESSLKVVWSKVSVS